MKYIEINGQRYLSDSINGNISDVSWDGRDSKTIHLAMDYSTAINLFGDNTLWSIVQVGERETIVEKEIEVEKEVAVPVEREATYEVFNEETGELEYLPVTRPVLDENGEIILDANGEAVMGTVMEVVLETQIVTEIEVVSEVVMQPYEEIYDNSEYCVAGPITDNRDGTVYIKMGKPTELELKNKELAEAQVALEEAYELMYGGI